MDEYSREEWRDIPGYVGLYQVSNLGRVRRIAFLKRKVTRKLNAPAIIQPRYTNGYARVALSAGGKHRECRVHRLVLEAFVGPSPVGYEAAHLNGIRSDCRLENLKWVTRKENHSHKKAHGTAQAGEKNPFCKLTAEQVLRIRDEWASGQSQRSLGRKYNTNAKNIQCIVRRVTWKHV